MASLKNKKTQIRMVSAIHKNN